MAKSEKKSKARKLPLPERKPRKSEAAPKPKAEKAIPKVARSDGAGEVIGERKLLDLAKLSIQTKSQAASATGTFREALGFAVEKYGLNTTAFGIANKLYKIGENDPVKLRIVMDAMEYYIDALKLHRKKAAMLDDVSVATAPKRSRKAKASETEVPVGESEPESPLVDSLHAALEADGDNGNVHPFRGAAEEAA